MKKSFFVIPSLIFFLLLSLSSCTDPAPATDQTTDGQQATEESEIDMAPSLSAPDCVIQGQVLDGNTFWMPEMDMVAVIKADESTTVDDVPSHRILELLNGRNCEVQFTETLPENTNPDYPYYIAQIQYNKGSHLLGIRGYYDIFVCDLDNNNKVSKLSPDYFKERLFDDPQSGMIQRIEVWENYLLGFAQDVGTFAFDLSDKDSPQTVIPFAEWQNPETASYHSLFLLPTEGGYQAIMPTYDVEEDKFILHPIFDQAQNISINVAKNARNNKFLVLRAADDQRKVFAIDLGQRKLMELPADVVGLKTQGILNWMGKQITRKTKTK